MRRVVWVVFVAAVAWYILYYYRPPRETAVLQTTLDAFAFDILLQRQPVVLYDRIADLNDLKTHWFPRNRSEPHRDEDAAETWRRSSYKYLLLQPEQDTELFLCSATVKMKDGRPPTDAVLLTIKLKAGQGLILPYRWSYCLPVGVGVRCLGVHDWLTPWLP